MAPEDFQQNNEHGGYPIVVHKRPSRLRKAWCEILGGHINEALPAMGNERCFALRLYCRRCGKTTQWYAVPLSRDQKAASGRTALEDKHG
jgi:hypothetical protein